MATCIHLLFALQCSLQDFSKGKIFLKLRFIAQQKDISEMLIKFFISQNSPHFTLVKLTNKLLCSTYLVQFSVNIAGCVEA